MKSLTDSYVLSNGVKIPCIGFGTWQTPTGDVAVSSVKAALQAGYRHIDTATAYGNEASVGEGIKQSGVARGDIFIATKLNNPDHGYDKTMAAFEKSMKDLDIDYMDLYLIHWPNPRIYRDTWQKTNAETWKAFEELYEAGRIKSIGISNFRPHHIDELMKTAKITPHINQIKLCPGETQDEVVDYCRAKDMLLEAYSPMGVGEIFQVPEMQQLAVKYNKSIAQICIRWSLQRGYLPLPKSVTPSRIQENTNVFDFELEASDVQLIADLKGCVGYAADPDQVPF